MSRQYCKPDVDRVEPARSLDDEADAEGNDDLRDDRDIEWTLGVARSLESAGVGERDGDEESGEGEHAQQLHAKVHNKAIVHPENREKLPREEEEAGSENGSGREADASRDLDPGDRAFGLARSQILSGYRSGRTHETY